MASSAQVDTIPFEGLSAAMTGDSILARVVSNYGEELSVLWRAGPGKCSSCRGSGFHSEVPGPEQGRILRTINSPSLSLRQSCSHTRASAATTQAQAPMYKGQDTMSKRG
jgi:hypothetical protein